MYWELCVVSAVVIFHLSPPLNKLTLSTLGSANSLFLQFLTFLVDIDKKCMNPKRCAMSTIGIRVEEKMQENLAVLEGNAFFDLSILEECKRCTCIHRSIF